MKRKWAAAIGRAKGMRLYKEACRQIKTQMYGIRTANKKQKDEFAEESDQQRSRRSHTWANVQHTFALFNLRNCSRANFTPNGTQRDKAKNCPKPIRVSVLLPRFAHFNCQPSICCCIPLTSLVRYDLRSFRKVTKQLFAEANSLQHANPIISRNVSKFSRYPLVF